MRDAPDDDAAEASTAHLNERSDISAGKRPKLDRNVAADQVASQADLQSQGADRSQVAQVLGGQGSGQRGQNKGRKFKTAREDRAADICDSVAKGVACKRGGPRPDGICDFAHSLDQYMLVKPKDIAFPAPPIVDGLKDDDKVHGLLRRPGTSFLGAQSQAYLDEHYSTSEPYCKFPQGEGDGAAQSDGPGNVAQSLRTKSTHCPPYHQLGEECPARWKCRFLGAHVEVDDKAKSTATSVATPELTTNAIKVLGWAPEASKDAACAEEKGQSTRFLDEWNWISTSTLRDLRKKEYLLPQSAAVIARLKEETDAGDSSVKSSKIVLTDEEIETQRRILIAQMAKKKENPPKNMHRKRKHQNEASEPANSTGPVDLDDLENEMLNNRPAAAVQVEPSTSGMIIDKTSIDTARIRGCEKRRLRWRGELYLAPLTTSGNLPFRRLCGTFGSDIHCGEMGLAESYLQGNPAEWSLVRRHSSERTFGVQLCGNRPDLLVPAAELLYQECGPNQLDFVDLNCGCPIDLVYKKGAGSALMDMPGRLSKILRGMSAVLGEVPVTIKMRTGTSNSKNTAHKLFGRIQTEFGVGAATIHGRSRQQRYRNLANWDYIRECTETLRSSVQEWNESSRTADEDEMHPVPIYGNGDVFSWEDYHANMEHTGVDGEMLARGALIKPWLFTEIKERKCWDISSRERLDMMRQFASYGLTHWGSDTQGVNKTRRFLCEAQSFWHRYVPVGLLEYLPPRMNDRPPLFKGRDDLETLLASGNSADWVRLSEMFLGKAPDQWSFLRKYGPCCTSS